MIIKSDLYLKLGKLHITHEQRIETFCSQNHCVKKVRIRSFSGPYFPAIRLNTSISPYSVRIRENTDQNNPEYEHFSRSGCIQQMR